MAEVRLSDLANIYSGYAFPTAELNPNTGIPILKIGNISNNTLNLNTDSFYSCDISNLKDKFLLKETDTLVCMTGATIGKAGRKFSLSGNKYLVNQRIAIVRAKNEAFADFIYLICTSNAFKNYVEQIGNGAAQANISSFDIGKFKFLFDIERVELFSNTLINYDKLIENNNKRIFILEQEAEELYKEWFVRFRFPEYKARDFKNVQIRGWTLSNSNCLNIPSNWEFCSFSKIGSFIRGKNITSDKMIPGNIPVISAGLEPSGFHNESNVKGPSITISASGANAGYMSLHFSDIWAADCSYYQSADWLWFAYSSLKFLQPVITNMQTGAAQPHVYPKHIDKLFIVIPDKDILGKYNLLVEPIFKEIKNLQERNTFLSNQRDYLLPRLMSGKLEVN